RDPRPRPHDLRDVHLAAPQGRARQPDAQAPGGPRRLLRRAGRVLLRRRRRREDRRRARPARHHARPGRPARRDADGRPLAAQPGLDRRGHRAGPRAGGPADRAGGRDVTGSHAIVIGAGVSGPLAPLVLAERYERVTVVERDRLPAGGTARAGVPQGRHIHALLARGVDGLRELFPGLLEDLVAGGVPTGDMLADGRVYFDGCLLARGHSGLPGLSVTRPGLEYQIRRRVAGAPNVTITQSARAVGFAPS